MFFFCSNIDDYEKYYYFNTHNRAGPWIIGALLGYTLSKIKLEKQVISIKLPRVSMVYVSCFFNKLQKNLTTGTSGFLVDCGLDHHFHLRFWGL